MTRTVETICPQTALEDALGTLHDTITARHTTTEIRAAAARDLADLILRIEDNPMLSQLMDLEIPVIR